jgi:uncharacterized repeat protein (TIGR03803 family)
MPARQALQETNKSNSSNIWRVACAAILLCFATVVAANAQTFNVIATLDSNANFAGPLVQGTDGNFYVGGTTESSGCGSASCSAIFKMTPTGTITVLHLGEGDRPLIRGGDGNLYGTDGGPVGANSGGIVFKLTLTGTFTTLYNFCSLANCADGQAPSSLMEASSGGVSGDFFGTTSGGGANQMPGICPDTGCGTIFRLTPQGQLTTLYSFCSQANCADGHGNFAGTLIQTAGGTLFGTAGGGIQNSDCTAPGNSDGIFCGTAFRITPSGDRTLLHSFNGTAGWSPNSPLIQAADGSFYGTTVLGGTYKGACPTGCGTFFKMSSSGQLTIPHVFCQDNNCPDGADPTSLLLANDGNFYGITRNGGATCFGSGSPSARCGTIFKVTPDGAFTNLYDFCPAGVNPCLSGYFPEFLIQGTDGKFYGQTQQGGSDFDGAVFSFDAGLPPFVTFLVNTGNVGNTVGILGQGFTGATAVSFNGTAATFTVKSDTYLTAKVPSGATTGSVTVTTPSGTLTSNVAYRVTQ